MKPNFERQNYIDGTFEDAVLQNCTLVQVKFDGIWCACHISYVDETQLLAEYYSRNNVCKARKIYSVPPEVAKRYKEKPLTYIGELMYGTERAKDYPELAMIVFDFWDFRHKEYHKRLSALLNLVEELKAATGVFSLVPTYTIDNYETLWRHWVVGGTFEGVVFRRHDQTYNATLIRQKLLVTADYYVIGFEEGEGKYKNTLGALILSAVENPELRTTASGMSDEERHHIWNNQTLYMNRVCELEGSGTFSSGLLRHPRFKRWRPIKE